ncbi:MAG: hypothetical protein HFJ40_04380 [Clostridia bacterium]|nr:hypothetical protein [Clostridia bacterium]
MSQRDLQLPVSVRIEDIKSLFNTGKRKTKLEEIFNREKVQNHYKEMIRDVQSFANSIKNEDNEAIIKMMVDNNEKAIKESIQINIMMEIVIKAFEKYVLTQIDIKQSLYLFITEELVIEVINVTKNEILNCLMMINANKFSNAMVVLGQNSFGSKDPGDEFYS